MSDKLHPLQVMLADASLTLEHRLAMLREVLSTPSPEAEQFAKSLLEALGKKSAEDVYQEKNRRLDAVLKELQDGPMRGATFVERLSPKGNLVCQALVLLDDGTEAYVVVPREEDGAGLSLGDRLVLDGKGRVLLHRAPNPLKIGEVAQLDRCIDDRHLEVSLRAGSERSVFLATREVMDRVRSGEIGPGALLIVSARRALVLAAVPPQDGFSHYRFLDRTPVPQIRVERDIGAPPRCIEEVTRHVRLELTQPELRRRYRLRRCFTKLLCGVSGTGKSLAVAAIHRRLYEVMSEVTGVPLEQLPPRVFRIRQSQILNMWLGESEKNWQRAMDEALQLASEPFTTPDGREILLPVLIVLEELDGLGRNRSHSQDAVYDRILTTVLQCLDPGRRELSDRLVIVLATTNEPQLVDPALLRRVGGSIENFSRLKRRAFVAVMDKLTDGLPAASNNGYTSRELWDRHLQDLTAWFFSPNGSDPGLVELTYAGSTTPVTKYRRDFLTAALADRAVQQAAAEACQLQLEGRENPGITLEQLTRAFEGQLRGMVDQLKECNVGSYTDLPDGVRVATLRRIPQPSHLSFEFHRR